MHRPFFSVNKYLFVLTVFLAALPALVHAQTTTVTFDNPAPSGAPDSFLNGIFQGVNFGTNQWRWSPPYSVNPTNHVYFANSTGTSRTFSFSPGPRVLTSMNVYTVTNGTLTLSDGVNPTVTRTVNVGSIIPVSTGWSQASTTITVGFTAGWALGVDDITYVAAGPADTGPPSVSMSAPAAGTELTGTVNLSANASDDIGVVGVQFFVDGISAGAEDLTAPYTVAWDSRAASNGAHVLTARARDLVGNQTTSAGVGVTVNNPVGSGFGYSMRFRGNGVSDIDRVKIRVDDPATTLPGPPVDVGATDFTLEFWMNGSAAENTAPLVSAGANNNWILGNTLLDRDRFGQDRNFGVSIAGGRVAFGVEGQATGEQTIVGTTNVLDNQWHHIAVGRRRSDGAMWIFVDGVQQAQADGPNGDISYPDNGVPGNFCNGPCTNSDPFLVIGAEKHDAGAQWPSYAGFFDEFRVSTTLRYTSNFTRPSRPFSPDANTVGLYHFDEGTGDYIYDSSGAYGGPSNAARNFGGSPAGPEWLTQTAFTVAPASEVGEWAGTYPWPLILVHSALLRTGQVLMLDGGTQPNIGGVTATLWNPATGAFTQVPNNSTDLFCSAQSFLPDGRVLYTGGNVDLYIGLRDTNIFNPVTSTWSRVANMTYARWYPATVTLGDGRVLAVSGSTNCNFCIVEIPEIYDPAANTWTRLTSASLAMRPTYPFLYLLPDGRALVAGSNEEPLTTSVLNISTQTWTTVDSNVVTGGAGVMYEPGRIMKSGSASDVDIGSTPTVRTTYVLDMNQPSPAWRPTGLMEFPRGLHDLTILPDGTVLATGGGRTTDGVNTQQAVRETEIWSPTTETWKTGAVAQRPRLYHSTALLLPDGRVLSAGSGRFGGFPQLDELNAEIYSPPYLFRGQRPIITSAPASIQYGTTFFVGNANPANISRVTLVAPGAATHQINFAQRFLNLSFTPTTGGLNVQLPSNSNLAPPGYHMLFLIGTNGVPSVASFVQVTANSSPAPVPAITNISPTSTTAGGIAFTLTVNGSGFVPASVVRWNGNSRTTTYVSAGQLTAAITAADIASAGTPPVTVFTPAPGGGTSNAVTFTITSNNPVPTTTSISPTSVTAGGGNFTLTVNGTGFVNGASTVRVNGNNRTTSFVSATQLTATVTAADIATAGSASITVFTGMPGGGTSNAQTLTINNPLPATTSISPSSLLAGSSGFTLTVNGGNFVNGSTVRWNGANRTTSFVSANQLTASIAAADVQTAGTASVTVFTATPGGGTSNTQTFTIASTNPVPTATSISPASVTSGGANFTLTVNGTGFVNTSSVVQVNGNNRTTNFVSANQLTATVLAADIVSAGAASITVFTGAPGGGTSNAQTLTIVNPNPVPATTSLSPNSANAGSGAFTLTVNGSNFINGSTVRWNGNNRTTSFVSANQLTASITAADVQTAGTASVTVFTGTPGGGTSNAQTFTINAVNPVPVTSGLVPASIAAGSAAFTLTVNGSNFVNGAVVRWNGADRTTTFGSANQLTAQILAGDVLAGGTASVTVFNPAPGGGLSNAQTFTIATGGAAPGLVAAYGLNAVTGIAVTDSSGNSNNGTTANTTWTASGRFGSALVFNGTSSMATVPDSNSLDLTTGMTLEAWVYPTVQPTGYRGIIMKEQPANIVYYLDAGSTTANQPATGVFAGGAERILAGGTRLAANVWTHLAATYDGANQRLYVNGVQVSSRAQTGPIATSTSPLRFGGNSVWGEYFQGRIDEVRIYNRALTQAEIQTDMNTAVP